MKSHYVESESVSYESCWSLCNSMDWGSSVCGILQARILESVVIPFSRGSSQPRDLTQIFCITGGFFTREALGREHPLSLQCEIKGTQESGLRELFLSVSCKDKTRNWEEDLKHVSKTCWSTWEECEGVSITRNSSDSSKDGKILCVFFNFLFYIEV